MLVSKKKKTCPWFRKKKKPRSESLNNYEKKISWLTIKEKPPFYLFFVKWFGEGGCRPQNPSYIHGFYMDICLPLVLFL